MAIARCLHCDVIIEQQLDSSWKHRVSNQTGTQNACNNPEIGMGLHDLVLEFWSDPYHYAMWAHQTDVPKYSPNCILSALQFQATIHWNCCGNSCNGRCTTAAQQHADTYMAEIANGRHDLHPTEDQEVHSIAFEIHNELVEAGTHSPSRGKPGIMSCSYIVGAGSSEACSCYFRGYARWVLQSRQILEHRVIEAATPVDPDDMYYEPRYE